MSRCWVLVPPTSDEVGFSVHRANVCRVCTQDAKSNSTGASNEAWTYPVAKHFVDKVRCALAFEQLAACSAVAVAP